MSEQNKEKLLQVRVPKELLEKADAVAELNDVSRSELVRRTLRQRVSATSPKEIEKKRELLEKEAKRCEKKAEEKKRKAKQLTEQLNEMGDAHEQYNDAVRQLADEIRDVENAEDSATAKVLRDASNPRIRKIAEIAKVEPQQVVRDVMNELAVESLDDLPETRVSTKASEFGKREQEPEPEPEAEVGGGD